jgi:putative peptidoglycan lipid II flippase
LVSLNRRSSGKNAVLVGAGILSSRLIGLLRERIFAYYFGSSDAADAFKAALRIPNLLQNLFGEGALSSSFIPEYASLLASGKEEEAKKVARVIGSILVLAMSILVLAGVWAAPHLSLFFAGGFSGAKRDFTIQMVRIMFPGMGILVLSAWCLGILNCHRRFFLPYAAPIFWSVAMIGALCWFGSRGQKSYQLAMMIAWAAVAGSVLQFGVQLPSVIRLVGRLRFQLDWASSNIRTVMYNFIPGFASRGINQLSGYIDLQIATHLHFEGAVATLFYAQNIYLLPVSLFGASISNAELPEMASQTGSNETVAAALCQRLNDAMRRVAFFIIPSVAGFLALGDSIAALLYQTGKFTRDDAVYVWMVLAGSTVGLLASALGRLYTSAFWALRDTRTPFRFASLRVVLTAALGWFLAFPVPRWIGHPRLGLVGLTISAGMAAWLEFSLLRSRIHQRIGKTGLPVSYAVRLWSAAITAAAVSFAIKYWVTNGMSPLISGIIVLLIYGLVYFAGTIAMRIPEALQMLRILRKESGVRSQESE